MAIILNDAEAFIKLSKDRIALDKKVEWSDVDIESNVNWLFINDTIVKKLYDKFGNLLYNGAIIELGEVSSNMYHIASLFAIETPCIIQIMSNSLAFFEDVNDELIVQDYKALQFDKQDVIAPIVFMPNKCGEFEMSLKITFIDTIQWTVKVCATSINVDERLKVMMSNFGHDYLDAYNDAMLVADNRQDIINNILQNDKIKEWLIRRDDIDSKLGTYSGLLNALDWLGYTNSVTLYEVLKNSVGNRMLIELGASIEKYAKTFTRTNLLMLAYAYNYISEDYSTQCVSMPIIKLSDTLPDQDTLKKLQNLVTVLENVFLPEHIHIADLQCDIFVCYILKLLYTSQSSIIETNVPAFEGISVTIKDIASQVDNNLRLDTDLTAYIRPHTMYIDDVNMQSPFTEPKPVFVVQETPVDDATINAQQYIDWFIMLYVSKIAKYVKFDKETVDLNQLNAYKDDIEVLSNTKWELLEAYGIADLFRLSKNSTTTNESFDNISYKKTT